MQKVPIQESNTWYVLASNSVGEVVHNMDPSAGNYIKIRIISDNVTKHRCQNNKPVTEVGVNCEKTKKGILRHAY